MENCSGCLPFAKSFLKIRLESKRNTIFSVFPAGKFPGATQHLKQPVTTGSTVGEGEPGGSLAREEKQLGSLGSPIFQSRFTPARFQRFFPRSGACSQASSERVVPFCLTDCSRREIRVPFSSKPSFIYQFQAFTAVFRQMGLICRQGVNAIPGRNLNFFKILLSIYLNREPTGSQVQ